MRSQDALMHSMFSAIADDNSDAGLFDDRVPQDTKPPSRRLVVSFWVSEEGGKLVLTMDGSDDGGEDCGDTAVISDELLLLEIMRCAAIRHIQTGREEEGPPDSDHERLNENMLECVNRVEERVLTHYCWLNDLERRIEKLEEQLRLKGGGQNSDNP